MFLASTAKIALISLVASSRHHFTVGKGLLQGLLNAVMIYTGWGKCSVAKGKYILRRMHCTPRKGGKNLFMHWWYVLRTVIYWAIHYFAFVKFKASYSFPEKAVQLIPYLCIWTCRYFGFCSCLLYPWAAMLVTVINLLYLLPKMSSKYSTTSCGVRHTAEINKCLVTYWTCISLEEWIYFLDLMHHA